MKSDSPKSVVDTISQSEKTTNTKSNTIRQLNIQVVVAVRVVLKAVPGIKMVGKPIIHAIYLRRNIGNWRGVWANLVRDGKTAFTIPDQEPEEC